MAAANALAAEIKDVMIKRRSINKMKISAKEKKDKMIADGVNKCFMTFPKKSTNM